MRDTLYNMQPIEMMNVNTTSTRYLVMYHTAAGSTETRTWNRQKQNEAKNKLRHYFMLLQQIRSGLSFEIFPFGYDMPEVSPGDDFPELEVRATVQHRFFFRSSTFDPQVC